MAGLFALFGLRPLVNRRDQDYVPLSGYIWQDAISRRLASGATDLPRREGPAHVQPARAKEPKTWLHSLLTPNHKTQHWAY